VAAGPPSTAARRESHNAEPRQLDSRWRGYWGRLAGPIRCARIRMRAAVGRSIPLLATHCPAGKLAGFLFETCGHLSTRS